MKTRDDIDTIKATVLYILESFKDGLDYIKLFKIMYYAQQESLVKYGRPIFNDTFKAKFRGPVPSFTYKCLKELEQGRFTSSDISEFNHSFEILNKESNHPLFRSLNKPDLDYLSRIDVKILSEVINKCKDVDSYDLSEKTHTETWKRLFEQSKNDPKKNIFTHIDIALDGGADEGIINYIREHDEIDECLS